MMWIVISLLCVASLFVIYAVYKVVWYMVIMFRLRIELNRNNVKLIKPFCKMIFGKKGECNFVVRTKRGNYSVAVISYITNHSRLNIEKKDSNYYIDVRRQSFMFKEAYYKSGEPELSVLHRSETSLRKTLLHLESPKDKTTAVLLFYPKPKDLTYADRDMKFLYSGDEVGSYKVMFWDDLKALMRR